MFSLVVKIKLVLIVCEIVYKFVPIGWPKRLHVVSRPRRVELVINREVVQIRFFQVHDPCLMVDDESGRSVVVTVDVVNSVSRIQVVVGRDAGPNVGHAGCTRNVVQVIENLELVEVRVAEELRGDCVLVALHDFVIIP